MTNVRLLHPPFDPVRWIESPNESQIQRGFRNATEHDAESIDDIIIEWSSDDDWKEVHIAILSGGESCVLAKLTKEKDVYEFLVWDEGADLDSKIPVLDHGGGEWIFTEQNRVPASEAFKIAETFSKTGEFRAELRWRGEFE